MAWEKRGDGWNRYYRTETTVAGRRTRHYFGTGPVADQRAASDTAGRQERREQRARAAELAGRLYQIFGLIHQCDALADMAFHAAMRVAGYHRHHRGEWIRSQMTGGTHMESTELTTWTHGAGPYGDWKGMGAALGPLLGAVAEGDAAVQPAVQMALDLAPRLAREWGDLSYQTELKLIKEAGGDIIDAECRRRFVAGLRRDLSLDGDSPLERLLIDRLVLCYLHLHVAEALPTDGMDAGMTEAHQKRIDRAQRRYLAAVKSLAQVRRLLVPSVQVNIAEKQINVVP